MARSFGSKGRILASMLGIAVVLGMTLAQSPPPAPIVPAPVVPGTPSAFPLAVPPADAAGLIQVTPVAERAVMVRF